jgi:YgiT-type zinc finger domain-containing protein
MAERAYPCEFCDTALEQEEKLVTLTLNRADKLYVFEDVPARVCPNCGHRYYNGPMITHIEHMIRDGVLRDAQPIEAYKIPYAAVSR